jgi:hypothetical protein
LQLRRPLHHPESNAEAEMKLSPRLEEYRIPAGRWASPPRAPYGAFEMPGPCGERLLIIASDGMDEVRWEHVSVSTKRRIPNWIEMSFAKDLFWEPEDCVVQFHPPRSAYVNNHPRCLHLWRYLGGDFPMPPTWTIGYQALGTLT